MGGAHLETWGLGLQRADRAGPTVLDSQQRMRFTPRAFRLRPSLGPQEELSGSPGPALWVAPVRRGPGPPSPLPWPPAVRTAAHTDAPVCPRCPGGLRGGEPSRPPGSQPPAGAAPRRCNPGAASAQACAVPAPVVAASGLPCGGPRALPAAAVPPRPR